MCNLFQKRCVNAKAMEEFRTHEPQNVADVRKLPGLFGCYRRYVENFSRIVNLLQIGAISTKSDMSHSSQQNENNKKIQVSFKTPVMWEEKHRQALNVLASHPVLATQTFHSLLFYILTLQKEVWEVCFTKKTRVIGYAS